MKGNRDDRLQQISDPSIWTAEGCWEFAAGRWTQRSTPVIKEMPLVVYVNGRELVTLLCTPNKLLQLVVGFLYLEGLIGSERDITYLRVCEEENVAEVRLSQAIEVKVPERRILTSGCGGGPTFTANIDGILPVDTRAVITPEQIEHVGVLLAQGSKIYPVSGGVHASLLSDGEKELVLAEDVGRHNTIDKIAGACLLAGIDTKDKMLFTTGRISSEMMAKSVKMRIPFVLSRSSPTQRAVAWAEAGGVTVIGYARGTSFTVYTHAERVQGIPKGQPSDPDDGGAAAPRSPQCVQG